LGTIPDNAADIAPTLSIWSLRSIVIFWSCRRLTASVGFIASATFVIRLSFPALPTDTVFGAEVTESEPIATALS